MLAKPIGLSDYHGPSSMFWPPAAELDLTRHACTFFNLECVREVSSAVHLPLMPIIPSVKGVFLRTTAVQDDLIHRRRDALLHEPKDVFTAEELKDYDKVHATGVLLHDRSLFVGPRPRR